MTEKIEESKAFYTRVFGAEVVYDSDWFILLRVGGAEIGFLLPGLESQAPLFRGAYPGAGAWLTVDTENVNGEYARIQGLGVPIEVALKDESWGDRHFAIIDPSGVGIDIVERDC